MITAEQQLQRAGRIGSSDAAAVLGLDPFRSAADVYLEKTGKVDPFEGNEATERGNLLEPVLVNYASRQIGKPVICNQMFEHASGLLLANLDAYVVKPEEYADVVPTEIIEAKSTVTGEEWGEAGTDQVPERVLVQIAHQFACVPTARIAWVPMITPGYRSFDWRLYRVERDDKLVKIVEQAGIDFMTNFVRPGIEPSDFRPSLEVLKRVRREPNKVVPVADELVARKIATAAAKKLACEFDEEAQASLLAAMGDAEGATYSGGTVTYLEVKRKGFVVEPTIFRKLNVKPAKALPGKTGPYAHLSGAEMNDGASV